MTTSIDSPLLPGEEQRVQQPTTGTGYDAIAEQMTSEQGAKVNAPAAPAAPSYDDIAGQMEDRNNTQLRTVLYEAAGTNPSEFAKAYDLSKRAGLPTDIVERNIPEIQRNVRLDEYAKILENSPAVAEQMRDPEFAKLAHEDLPNLTALETTVKALKLGTGAFASGLVPRSNAMLWGVARAGTDALSSLVTGPLSAAGLLPEDIAARMSDKFQQLRDIQLGYATRLEGDRSGLGDTALGALQGIQSTGQALPGLIASVVTGSPAPVLSLFGAETGGDAYVQGKEAGLDTGTALTFGTLQGATEVMTELFPELTLLKGVKSGAPLWQTILKTGAQEVWTEQAATAIQDFNEWAYLRPEKTLGDYLRERPQAAYQTLVATLTGVGLNVAASHATALASGVYGSEQQQVVNAESFKNRVVEATKIVEQSTLRETAPDKLEGLIDRMVPDGDVYINAHEFTEFFQSQGVNPMDIAGQLTGVAGQLPEALTRGGDIRIKASEYINRLGGTEYQQGLNEIVRAAPEEMSAKEAAEWQKNQGERFQQIVDQVNKDHETDSGFNQSAQQVEDFVRDEIVKTGRFDTATATKYAALHGAMAKVLASKLGLQPHQIYEKYGLRVAGVPLEQDGAQYDQNDQRKSNITPENERRLGTITELMREQLNATLEDINVDLPSPISIPGDVQTLPQLEDYVRTRKGELQQRADATAAQAATMLHLPTRDTLNESVQNDTDTIAALDALLESAGKIARSQRGGGEYDQAGQLRTDTPAFRKWFGDSKVVDENGAPLVVYHSSVADFDKFKRSRSDIGLHFGTAGQAEDRFALKIENDPYGPQVRDVRHSTIPVYLSIKNPLRMDDAGAWNMDNLQLQLLRLFPADRHIIGDGFSGRKLKSPTDIRRYLQGKGYDGVVYKNTGESGGAIPLREAQNRAWSKVSQAFPGRRSFSEKDTQHPAYREFDAAHKAYENYRNQHAEDSYIAFEPTQIKSAIGNNGTFDPTDPNILHQSAVVAPSTSTAGRDPIAGFKREKNGRYVGAPDWVGASPQQLGAMYRKLRQLALEGTRGRYWYEESSRAILALAGGDKVEAEKIVGLIAIYSPNNTVPGNTYMALKAYYDWKAGNPIRVGFKSADKKAEDLLRRGEYWSGIKTGSFYQNLMIEIDASKLDPGIATMDMWVAIAGDYGLRALDQGPKYEFMELMTKRVGEELGWDAHQVQAAIWSAMKGRVDPIRAELTAREIKLGIKHMVETVDEDTGKVKKVAEFVGDTSAERSANRRRHFKLAHKMGMKRVLDAKDIDESSYNFGNSINDRSGQISYEFTPGVTSGKLPGIHTAPMNQQVEYAAAMRAAFTDHLDADIVGKTVGLATEGALPAYSGWEGITTTGIQEGMAVPITAEGVPDGALRIINLIADIRGLLFSQEGVAWHVPRYNGSKFGQNGIEFTIGRTLTHEETDALYKALVQELGHSYSPPIATPDGMKIRVLNFPDEIWELAGTKNKAKRKELQKILREKNTAFATAFATAVHRAFVAQEWYNSDTALPAHFESVGELRSNNWENGDADYRGRIAEAAGKIVGPGQNRWAERSDIFEWIEHDLRPRVEAVDADFVRRYGWDRPGTGGTYSQSAVTTGTDGRTGQDPAGRSTPAVRPDGLVELTHWGKVGGLAALDPGFHGKGIAGAETRRKLNNPDTWVDRTYYGLSAGQQGGYRREASLGTHKYTAAIAPERLYDIRMDPDNLSAGDTTAHEKAIRDAGYAGYWVDSPSLGMVAAVFEPLPVENYVDERPNPYLQPARGSIQFPVDLSKAPSLITLFEGADLSTFLHETGHFFFEMYRDVASQPGAPAAVRADMDALLAFVGVASLNDWNSMSPEQRREGHEKVARAFEAYLFEGEAPSPGLRELFRSFGQWLLHVYKSIKGLNVDLTPEVRQVFDRMLASEEEIRVTETMRQYAPLFESIEQAGMTVEAWAEYQALSQTATDDASIDLQHRSLKDMRWLSGARARELKRLQRDAEAKRKDVRVEATEKVYGLPIFAARRYITHGDREPTITNQKTRRLAEDLALEPHKLSKTALLEMYGDGPAAPWRYLSTGTHGLMAQEGAHPNEIAELFGIDSGDALVRGLLEHGGPEETIDALTDKMMMQRYGDLSNPAVLEHAADLAVHNDARLRFMATELRTLDSLINVRGDTGRTDVRGRKITYDVLANAARDFAAQVIGRKTVRDAVKTGAYAAAETRAGKAAEQSMRKGDIEGAATHKRAQLLNAHFFRAAARAGEEIDKITRYLKRFESDGTRKGLDRGYLDQIDQLLERIDMRKSVSQKELERRASLKDWVAAQEEAGFSPAVPQSLLDDTNKKHFTQLTLDEFRGLRDAVKSIEHLGRLKKKLLTAKDQREFDALIDDAVASIEEHSKGVRPQDLETDLPKDKLRKTVAEFFASHRKIADILRHMDGFNDNGAMWNLLMRPLNDASANEAVMREESTLVLHQLFTDLHTRGKLYQKELIPEIGASLTKMGRLSVALNLGNDTNRARLNQGYGWTPEQIHAITNTLTAEDWAFVQAIWDHIDSYWPAIEAKELRVNGVAPAKVVATPVSTPFGELRGGYYPIKYDLEQSPKAYQQATAEAAKQAMRGAFARATTRRGHLEQRVEEVNRRVSLSFSTIFQHLEQVVHDIAMHEYLIDQARVLNDPRMQTAIVEHYGPEIYRQLTNAMTAVAAGDVPATQAHERAANWMRAGASIAGMGWKLTTAMMQPIGLTQSMARIGPKWVGRGIAHWITGAHGEESTVEWIYSKSPVMRLRGKTLMREISEIRNRITKESWFQDQLDAAARVVGGDKAPDISDSFFYLITKFQMVADIPTWLGQYEKSMAQGLDEDTAIAVADQAVLDAQGGGQMKDLAAIQRGNPWFKLWTNFYSYFNVTYNRNVEAFAKTNYKSPASIGRLGVDLLLLNTLPALLTTLMYEAAKGGCDGDWKCIGEKIAGDQMSYMLGNIVGLRELQAMFSPYGYGGPAGARVVGEISKLGKQIGQGELDEPLFREVNQVAGIMFHYPAGQVDATARGFAALINGDTSNPAVLAFGPERKH